MRTPKRPVQPYRLGDGREDSTSEAQEKRIAGRFDQVTRTFRVPGSGCGVQKGDVHTLGLFLIEAKTVEPGTASISLRKDHLLKVLDEARQRNLAPLLVVSFPEMPMGADQDYMVVPARVFLEMLGAWVEAGDGDA